jgi:hypothetical protein
MYKAEVRREPYDWRKASFFIGAALSLFLYFGITGNAHAAISFVQSTSTLQSSGSAATNLTKAFRSNVTKGDLLIIGTYGAVGDRLTATDTLGDTFTMVAKASNANDHDSNLLIATTSATGADTVTVHDNTQAGLNGISIHEYSGTKTNAIANIIDASSTSVGNSASLTTGNITTKNPGDLVFAYFATGDDNPNVTFTYSGAYTRRELASGITGFCAPVYQASNCIASEDKIFSATSTTQATTTISQGADQWTGVGISIVQGSSTPNPIISSFSATPGTILVGSSSFLSWSVANASSVLISGNNINLTTSTASGTVSVTPNATGTLTYTLSAVNASGSSTATTSIAIDSASPSVPANLTAPNIGTSTVALTWSSSTDAGGPGVSGYAILRCVGTCTPTSTIATSSVPAYTDSSLAPATTYTYTVQAYDALGLFSGSATPLVVTTQNFSPPVITAFSASPSFLSLGSSSLLSFQVSPPFSSLTIIGSNLSFSTSTASGTVSVIPNATGTLIYTLTVGGPSGTSTATTTIGVISKDANDYFTSFPLTENPISENGNWTVPSENGDGSLWGDVETVTNQAFGVSGPTQYGDATAVLTGTWSPDQSAQATIYVGSTTYGSCCTEAALHLRTTISPGSITGYELGCSLVPGDQYCGVTRWNGANGSYCSIQNFTDYVKNGDVMKGTITGTNPVTISMYINGVLMETVTDNGSGNCPAGGSGAAGPWTSGSPGIGFATNQNNWNTYGFSNFTAAASASLPVISSFAVTPQEILAGASSTLSWNVDNADSVSITGGSLNISTTTVIGSLTINPTSTTTYTLSAVNATGSSTATTSITVEPVVPVITAFSASPSSLTLGSSTALAWNITGSVSSVTITGDALNLTTSTASGTAGMMPDTVGNEVYTITAFNGNVSSTATTSVTVNPQPVPNLGIMLVQSSTAQTSTGNSVTMTLPGNVSANDFLLVGFKSIGQYPISSVTSSCVSGGFTLFGSGSLGAGFGTITSSGSCSVTASFTGNSTQEIAIDEFDVQ